MLSRESIEARMWEPFPALRSILQDKRIPDHYYGFTSVSDHMFDQVGRLLKLVVLVRENAAEIGAALKAEAKHECEQPTDRLPPLLQDLRNLESRYLWARSLFDDAIRDLHTRR